MKISAKEHFNILIEHYFTALNLRITHNNSINILELLYQRIIIWLHI